MIKTVFYEIVFQVTSYRMNVTAENSCHKQGSSERRRPGRTESLKRERALKVITDVLVFVHGLRG